MSETPKVWMNRAGGNGEDETIALDQNLSIIGFDEVPSLEGVEDWDALYKMVEENIGGKPRAVGNYSGQLWAFRIGMQKGDLVVLPQKLTSQVAIGKVSGPYKYSKIGSTFRHVRPVDWIRPDVARSTFRQDLLYSMGAFMTVCEISRNDAGRRIAAVLKGGEDPGHSIEMTQVKDRAGEVTDDNSATEINLHQFADDQITAHIQSRFSGHDLALLVEAVLLAEGWFTKISPPGPVGGVEILAGRGSLGLDKPRLCVQVKSQTSACDVTVYRTLQGSMQTFDAEQGLLVCWGGFNRAVLSESKQRHFSVRLWDSSDLVEAIFRNYEKLPAEIQAELPLKKIWTLVKDERED